MTTGLVTVSMPPVMKTSKLTIKKRDSLVTEVVEFTRNEKVQLEYILMWALTKMMQPQHGYLGYKGNIILHVYMSNIRFICIEANFSL
jgi:hypothetical protein